MPFVCYIDACDFIKQTLNLGTYAIETKGWLHYIAVPYNHLINYGKCAVMVHGDW